MIGVFIFLKKEKNTFKKEIKKYPILALIYHFMRKVLFLLILLFLENLLFAQTTYLNRNSDNYFQIERFDILNEKLSDSLHTSLNGMSRKEVVHFLENYIHEREGEIQESDMKTIQDIISINGEWAESGDGAQDSEYSLWDIFYDKKPDFLHYSSDKVYFVLNPIIYYQQTVETGNLKQNLFYNSKGIEARGLLAKRIGFYTRFTDNQERGPIHHQYYVRSHQSVPGATYYKDFKETKPGYAQDYLLASGYVDAELVKNMVNVTFGSDRFQIGDGYRSLFLSDFGPNYTFLKLNTRFWKFNYQNLYMELTPQYFRGADRLLPRKYATMHHLSIDVTKGLNVGLFEGIVFSRKDHFDVRYLNPIILYRSIEQTNGSPDNAMLGFNFKINTGMKAVLYGQMILDEFSFSHIKAADGWWANKYGFQGGVKLADVFGLRNFMAQAEFNYVRPFTYSYSDSVADYTNYNQPLAHPYGANFMEVDLILHYRPLPKLYLTSKTFFNRQGRDTLSSVSFGGNIFKDYNKRSNDFVRMFNGYPSDVFYTNLNMSYEFLTSFFFDLGVTYRNEKSTHPTNPTWNSLQVYTGLRINSVRREYDY